MHHQPNRHARSAGGNHTYNTLLFKCNNYFFSTFILSAYMQWFDSPDFFVFYIHFFSIFCFRYFFLIPLVIPLVRRPLQEVGVLSLAALTDVCCFAE